MKTRAKFVGAALVGAFALLAAPAAQAQVGVSINLGAPAWGPAVPYGTQYYYIPEIDGYYDLYSQQYIVFQDGYWVPLPELYGYDPYQFHPVVIDYRGRQPWLRSDYYHNHYAYRPYQIYGPGRGGYYAGGYGRPGYGRGYDNRAGYYNGRGRDDHHYDNRGHDDHDNGRDRDDRNYGNRGYDNRGQYPGGNRGYYNGQNQTGGQSPSPGRGGFGGNQAPGPQPGPGQQPGQGPGGAEHGRGDQGQGPQGGGHREGRGRF